MGQPAGTTFKVLGQQCHSIPNQTSILKRQLLLTSGTANAAPGLPGPPPGPPGAGPDLWLGEPPPVGWWAAAESEDLPLTSGMTKLNAPGLPGPPPGPLPGPPPHRGCPQPAYIMVAHQLRLLHLIHQALDLSHAARLWLSVALSAWCYKWSLCCDDSKIKHAATLHRKVGTSVCSWMMHCLLTDSAHLHLIRNNSKTNFSHFTSN